jgi:hypothetical protein
MNEDLVKVGGFYRHYKGDVYRVTAIGRHTETAEEMVIYHRWNPISEHVWIRPLSMFTETVEHDGKTVKRFQDVGA